jgi:sortase A
MRRLIRVTGTLLAIGGIAMLAWAFTVWRWQDPVTTIYTYLEQRELEQQYEELLASSVRLAGPAGPTTVASAEEIAEEAARYRQSLGKGEAVGRLEIPRLGLDAMIVEGTDNDSLKRGPGRYRELFLPGEGELIYVAGHRTTYSAPFSRIDELRPGDEVTVDVPYGRFVYRITRHRIVAETELSVLKTQGEEVLALQACHPRFFASHRYIAYAEPVEVEPRMAAASGAGADAVPAGGG